MEWISIKDKLPPTDTCVIVYLPCEYCFHNKPIHLTEACHNRVDVGMYSFFNGGAGEDKQEPVYYWTTSEPLYWMPLPPSPLKEKDS